MQDLVHALCSPRCAGRAPGTPGGIAARAIVVDALRAAGLDPVEQPVPGCAGANVLATLAGASDRFVIVGAHYDHLGRHGGHTFWGADDNAAAVAIMVEVARALAAAPPAGRSVLFAAFDGEEPPHFLSSSMGSEHFARQPTVPLDRVDLMVCMDLVGHGLGPEGLPDEVRATVMALGAERSEGTAAHVDRLARAVPGVIVRRADAEVIPPMSDYDAFWRREVPFLFLSCGQSRIYHTPEDTPDRLDWGKMAATARWLERFVRETCARPEPRIAWRRGGADDAATLRSAMEICAALAPFSPEALSGLRRAERLLAQCGADGVLPAGLRGEAAALIQRLHVALA